MKQINVRLEQEYISAIDSFCELVKKNRTDSIKLIFNVFFARLKDEVGDDAFNLTKLRVKNGGADEIINRLKK